MNKSRQSHNICVLFYSDDSPQLSGSIGIIIIKYTWYELSNIFVKDQPLHENLKSGIRFIFNNFKMFFNLIVTP